MDPSRSPANATPLDVADLELGTTDRDHRSPIDAGDTLATVSDTPPDGYLAADGPEIPDPDELLELLVDPVEGSVS